MLRTNCLALAFLACAITAYARPACDKLAAQSNSIELAKAAGYDDIVLKIQKFIPELTLACNKEKAALGAEAPGSSAGNEHEFGMTFQQAEATGWGKPTTVSARVQWVYVNSVTQEIKYLYFTNGRLSGIEQ